MSIESKLVDLIDVMRNKSGGSAPSGGSNTTPAVQEVVPEFEVEIPTDLNNDSPIETLDESINITCSITSTNEFVQMYKSGQIKRCKVTFTYVDFSIENPSSINLHSSYTSDINIITDIHSNLQGQELERVQIKCNRLDVFDLLPSVFTFDTLIPGPGEEDSPWMFVSDTHKFNVEFTYNVVEEPSLTVSPSMFSDPDVFFDYYEQDKIGKIIIRNGRTVTYNPTVNAMKTNDEQCGTITGLYTVSYKTVASFEIASRYVNDDVLESKEWVFTMGGFEEESLV